MTLLLLPSRLGARRPGQSLRPRLFGLDGRVLLADRGNGPSGALGNAETGQAWSGATWTRDGAGAAINTPTLGAEVLTDPGLEATYTAGLCNSLIKPAGGIVAQSADVHGGSKAQEFTAGAASDRIVATPTTVVGIWYHVSGWAKRTAGSGGTVQLQTVAGFPITTVGTISGASYTQYFGIGKATGTNGQIRVAESGSVNFDTIITDDWSLKALTLASLFCTVDCYASDVLVEAEVSVVAGTQAGLVLRLDSASNPQSFLIAHHNGTNLVLETAAGLTYATPISTAATYAQWRKISVELRGNSVRAFYNQVQIGNWQTLSDARLLGGTRFGLFSTYSGNAIRNLTVRRLGQAA